METGNATIDRAKGHYTIVTADSHAGGSHAAYREYLDPKYLEDFDAWRAKYKNPFKDLGDTRRFRNWDNEMRNGQEEEDGVVRPRPRTMSTGWPGSGRTTAGWWTSAASSPSAGPGSVRSSSTTSTTPSKTSSG
jgi:hypothetical protein